MAGLAGCTAGLADTESSGSEATNRWPDPKDGQRKGMLLGTTHLAQSPGDTPNAYATDPGNILGDKRQRELETLTDRLVEWDPDRIAVEHPVSEQSLIDRAFDAYANDTGELSAVSGWEMERSDEVVQIGFRLANKLNHESVAAVDYRQSPAALLTEEERKQLPNSIRKFIIEPDSVEYPLPNPAEYIEEQQRQLNENSLVEFYKYLNNPKGGVLPGSTISRFRRRRLSGAVRASTRQ